MKMKKIALACGAALLGMSAVAQAEWSANIGVTSNYVWRGWTQTDDEAAVQGGVDYSHESGFYAGTWASNVNFPSTTTLTTGFPPTTTTIVNDDTGAEVDFYGGFAGEYDAIGYDVGIVYYAYPQYDDSDFTEIYGSASYKMFEAGIAYTIAADIDNLEGDVYYYASAGLELPEGFGLGVTIGHADDGGALDYTHYQLDVTKGAGDFGDFTLSVSDNDEADSDPKVFVSWGKSF